MSWVCADVAISVDTVSLSNPFFFLFKFFSSKLFLFLFTNMSFLGIDFTFESFIIKIINIMKENVRACLGTSLKTVFYNNF